MRFKSVTKRERNRPSIVQGLQCVLLVRRSWGQSRSSRCTRSSGISAFDQTPTSWCPFWTRSSPFRSARPRSQSSCLSRPGKCLSRGASGWKPRGGSPWFLAVGCWELLCKRPDLRMDNIFNHNKRSPNSKSNIIGYFKASHEWINNELTRTALWGWAHEPRGKP